MSMPSAKEPSAGEERRALILDAALELFSQRGFDATSVQKVAEHAGMSKQALMHHYPSKERLRLALMDRLSRRWQDFFPTFLTELTSEQYDRYRYLVELIGEHFKTNAMSSRFIARELLDRPEETVRWLIDNGTPWLKVVTNLTARQEDYDGVEQGQDIEAHVMVLAGLQMAVSAFVFSNPVLAKDHHMTDWQDRLHDATKRIVRRGSGIDPDQERPVVS